MAIVLHRREHLFATVELPGGVVSGRIKQGVLMGDNCAPVEFRDVFQERCVVPWNAGIADRRMWVTSPFGGMKQDVSVTVYADDIMKHMIVEEPTAQAIDLQVRGVAGKMDEALAEGRFKQNLGKLAVLLDLSRRVGRVRSYERSTPYMTLDTLKHLGGLFTLQRGNGAEVGARILAANRCWSELSGAWFSAMPRRLKRLLFVTKVQNAALSGLTSYVLCDHDCRRLDRCLQKKLRAVLQEGAVQRTEQGM